MKTQHFVFGLLKIILNFLSQEPKLLLFPNVGPLPSTKKYFCNSQNEMINYYQYQNVWQL